MAGSDWGGGLALVAGFCGHSLGLGIVGLVSATPLSERVLFFSFDFVVCFKHLKGRGWRPWTGLQKNKSISQ